MNSLPQASLDFRPVPLWSWNDRMDADQCAEMMKALAAAGYGGAYLHARLGMPIEFMSGPYLEAVKASVSAAADCGVRAHLYDEDRWPSGWAGGAVPLTNAAFRVKALLRRRKDEAGNDDSRPIAESNGFRYFVETMSLGHPKFNGTCYADLANPDAMRCFLESAYEPLRECLGDAFGRATPTIFTDEPALTYLYTWPDGGLPWSDRLPERFFATTGIKLTDTIAALFEDRPGSARIRVCYYRILAELFAESFMQQISAWCCRHGIRWTGHFMYEHSLPLHFSWSANCHGLYRYFDWPGVDHLGRQVGEVVTAIGCRSAVHQFGKERMMSELFGASGQHLSFADRKWIAEQQIVLGVNHLVPHLMSTTLLGARKRDYPPTLSSHQPWWPVNPIVEDHLARLCEIMSAGTPMTDLLVIHPQESAYVLSRGPVAVGKAETWVGRFFHSADDLELEQMDREWKRLCHRLLDAGYLFDFGDEAVLAECGRIDAGADGAKLAVGAATYRAVLLPPLVTIRPSTLNKLTAFAQAGGLIIQLGDAPRMVDGQDDIAASNQLDELARNISLRCMATDELVARMLPICPPEMGVESTGLPAGRIWQYTKSHGRDRKSFLVNLDRLRTRQAIIRWRHPPDGPIIVWHTHLATSESADIENGHLTLHMPPGGSCILVAGERPPLVPLRAERPSQCRTFDIESLDCQVTRLDDNALVIDQAEFRIEGNRWQGPFPVLAVKEWLDERRYIGPLEVRYEFAAEFAGSPPSPLQMIVEGIERAKQVRLNGHPIDTREVERRHWLDPHWHPIAVPSQLLGEQNRVELAISEFRCADPGSADATRRTGTDVESLMILGDFSVDGVEISGPQNWQGQIEHHTFTPLADWLPPQPLRYFAGPFVLRPARHLRSGGVTGQGLPFYAGRLRYEAELNWARPANGAVLLKLSTMTAPVAEVEVNGRRAGCFAWPPYEVDIAPCMEDDVNRIAITLYHSLRNLLGPHHNPDGEPVYVTPGSFRPEGCARWLDALRADEKLPAWTDRYGLVEFGLMTCREQTAGAD